MKFSVLLSVYVKEDPVFLRDALFSIFDNQSLKPDQVVLVQDGPLTSGLYVEIDKFKGRMDGRLTILTLPENVGLATALNEGLKVCRNDLVARMDTDDISQPDRFEKQTAFMFKSPEVAVCSGQIEEWNQDFSSLISERKVPTSHAEIVKLAKSRSPISHPAVMFRKSAVLALGGYPNIYPEDYLLWGKMLSKGYKFANLNSVILKMRVDDAVAERRGGKFLKGIVRTYSELHKIGFITQSERVRNTLLRSLVSLSPPWVRRSVYRFLR